MERTGVMEGMLCQIRFSFQIFSIIPKLLSLNIQWATGEIHRVVLDSSTESTGETKVAAYYSRQVVLLYPLIHTLTPIPETPPSGQRPPLCSLTADLCFQGLMARLTPDSAPNV